VFKLVYSLIVCSAVIVTVGNVLWVHDLHALLTVIICMLSVFNAAFGYFL